MDDLRAPLRRGWARARLWYHTVSDLGLRTTGQVLANSRRRGRMGTEWAQRTPAGPPLEPGALEHVAAVAGGARFVFAHAELEVACVSADVVRLTWGPGELLPYAFDVPSSWRAPEVTLRSVPGGTSTLSGGDLELTVSSTGELTLARRGELLRHQPPPRRQGTWWEHRFTVRPDERLSGLGEQAAGADLRGVRLRLWNRDPGGGWGPGRTPLYMAVPVVLGSHPGGDVLSFYDNASSAEARFPGADEGEAEASLRFAGGALRQYLVVGDLPTVLERYAELTGRPALPPRWALGHHQSRWGYRSAAHVGAVLEGYRAMGVPLSAVHLDIDYMDRYRVFTVDARRFPDLAALAACAGRQGVRLVTIVDPAVKVDPHYGLYRKGLGSGLFCSAPSGEPEIGVVWPGRAAFPDFTSALTRQWWSEQYRTLTDAGVGGVWHDMNEPTSISLVGDPTLPLSTRHDVEGRGGDHAQVHNLYGRLMNEAGYEGLRRARPGSRPFVLSRSGWAGNQRWAWTWTGDAHTSWAALRQQVATVVGLGLSGIPFAGSDIGGFTGVPDAELYLRWLQMSVLMALCRTHSVVGTPGREPWRFPEPARSAIASWIRLRYRLLPYLYTLAHQAADSGLPVVRPLWWPAAGPGPEAGRTPAAEVPRDAADDTFLLGDALVVAPMTAPGESWRRVWLPPGAWRSLWAADGDIESAGPVTASAPLERAPVFVRAGSVLPLDDGWARPGSPCALPGDDDLAPGGPPAVAPDPDHVPVLFALHCWPQDGSASGAAVDDAGDGDGPVRRDEFVLSGAAPGATAVLRWRRSGAFPAPERLRVVLHGLEATSATADGIPLEVRGGSVQCAPFEELRLEGLRPEHLRHGGQNR